MVEWLSSILYLFEMVICSSFLNSFNFLSVSIIAWDFFSSAKLRGWGAVWQMQFADRGILIITH